MILKENTSRKTVLITGTTSGIGYELVKLFAMDGFSLVLVSRNKQKLADQEIKLKKKYRVDVYIIVKDLSDPKAPEEILSELREKSIHIDILVNNAGFNECGPFYKTDLKKELQMIQLHIATVTNLTKLFLPDMLKERYGKILNIASTGSFMSLPLNAVYGATKAYILSFSEAIAAELVDTGITVTTLCPGATKTEFAKKANIEDTRLFQTFVMDAEKVARVGYKSLMKGKRVVVVGLYNKSLVLTSKIIPKKLRDTIAEKVWEKV